MAEEKYTKAVCRISGFEKDKAKWVLLGIKRGERKYMGGGFSEGPIFYVIEEGTADNVKEAKEKCLEAANRHKVEAKVVAPQKVPKFKFGHAELYRLLGDVAFIMKRNRKIGFVPGYLITKVITGKRTGRANAKRFMQGPLPL